MAASAADLFDRFHLAIYRYLLRMTGRRDVAEDLTQDVFVRVLGRTEPFDPGGGERAWLFQVARNLLVDWQRRAVRNPVRQMVGPDPEDAVEAIDAPQETDLHVREALAQLSDADREAFLLRVVGGLGHEEIATMSGSTPASVRSRIFRARSALRTALAGHLARPSKAGPDNIRRFKVVL